MNNNILLIKNLLSMYLTEKGLDIEPIVELPNFENQGHLATNLAMVIAKRLKQPVDATAKEIVEFLNKHKENYFAKLEIKKPGFINFYLTPMQICKVLDDVLKLKDRFGAGLAKQFKYNLEIVSANPTGYLHIGHARNGAIGDSVARILRFAGYDVIVEYYTNDAGNQINILAVTVFVEYLKLLGKPATLPEDCYRGEMYTEVAQEFVKKYGEKFADCTFENNLISDPAVHKIFREESTEHFMEIIEAQLKRFRVDIQYYISEQSMYDNHLIEEALDEYREKGALYEKDGATWLKTTEFGDDKDRVLIKSDGTYTYITPDLASHKDKMERTNADKLVNFWGGDHHGYIKRMQAGLELFGFKPDLLEIDMIQMVRLIKNGQEYKMSKRKGTAVWLVDVLDMLGTDIVRYMLSSKSPASHMDFDIGLMEEQSSKNPVFYAQYAAARCCSIIKQAKSLDLKISKKRDLLVNPKELDLMVQLDTFSKHVEAAGKSRLPHIICDYIQLISKKFHSYYNECKVVHFNVSKDSADKEVRVLDQENKELSQQRYALVVAILQVLSNAFGLIGVEVKEEMNKNITLV